MTESIFNSSLIHIWAILYPYEQSFKQSKRHFILGLSIPPRTPLLPQKKQKPKKQSFLSFLYSFHLILYYFLVPSLFIFVNSSPFSLCLHIHLSSSVPLLMPVSMSWRVSGSVWTVALWLISVIQPLSTGRLFAGDKWCWHNKNK